MKIKNLLRLTCLTVMVFSTTLILGQGIGGDWYSILKIQGAELSMVIHLTESESGLSGTFDVPEQGAAGIPLTYVELADNKFSFAFDPAGFSYSGLTEPSFSNIIGYFSQPSASVTEQMIFSRTRPEPSETHPDKLREIYEKKELYIEMRDGVKLFTSIYSPRNSTRPSPMIIFRSPYNSEPGGENAFNFFVSAYHRLVKEGYILVFQDVRGRFQSEGDYVNVRPFNPDKRRKEIDEASDTYDTADWLVRNVSNNNGNIGVMGISYPGFYSTMAILAGHPAIKAVSPQAPVTNWFIGDDWHHNGAFFLIDGFSFYTFFGDPRPSPSRMGSPLDFSWNSEDSYEYFLRMGPIRNTKKIFPESVKYWYEIFDHPNYDDWWKATDPRPYLKNVKPAVMTVGGWFDAEDLWGALHTYRAIEDQNPSTIPNYLVMGPWSHGQWATGESRNLGNVYWGMATNDYYHELEVRFFNHYLKNEQNGDFAEATIFVTGENEWLDFETWPPNNVTDRKIYFEPGGGLGFSAPAASEDYVEYVSDPSRPVPYMEDVHLRRDPVYMDDDQRFASRRPDVAVFQTGVLDEDITLTGPVTADIYISTSGTDADVVVKLIDVFPDVMPATPGSDPEVPLGGYQMLVRGEVMRGKYRNSYENPEPFVPGEPTKVTITLPDVAHTFRKGHRIMVQVQNSWFPLVDRNPQKFVNIYECGEEDFQKATIRIFNDITHPSGLNVLTLNR